MITDMSAGLSSPVIDGLGPIVFDTPLPVNPDLFQIDCLTGVDSGPTVIGLDAGIQTDNCGCDV